MKKRSVAGLEVDARVQTEEELRASEQRYRQLVELSPDAILVHSEGKIVFINAAGARLLGAASPRELIGKPLIGFVHLDYHEIAGARFRQIRKQGRRARLATKKPVRLQGQMKLVRLDGQVVHVELVATNITYDGKPAAQVIVRDLTERRRAEQALQESEERLRTVVTNAPVVLFAIDREGVFTLSEGRGLAALGLRPGGGVGRSVFDVYRDVPEIIKNVRRALAGEAFTATVDVAELVFETHYAPVRDHEGEVSGIIGVATDVTERKRAEEARRLTQFSVDRAADAAFWLAPDARILYVNDAACRSLGYSRDELLSMSIHDIDPDFPPEGWRQRWQELKERGCVTIESRHRTKDGRIIPVEITVNFLEFDGKEYNCAFARDITERKRAEEALRASEAKYRSIFENVQDIFYQVDLTGIIIEISPSVERYGYTREGLIGTQVLDIYEKPEERAALVKTLIERGEVADYEIRLKTGDGRVADASVSAHLLRGPDGAPIAIEGSLRDISDRKRAEEALRESEERYRELFENANDIIYTHDLTGRFTSVNGVAEQVTGYTRAEALKENIAKVVAPEYLDMAREMILRKVRGEPSSVYEVEIITKDGRRVPLEVSTRLIYKDGKPVGVQGIARDISERKRLERQLVHLANHDPLTHLFNRRRLEEELERELARARDAGIQGALLFLDLDQFKDVNDSLGHRAGDELLASLAGLLRQRLRRTDIVARPGGDEFAILLSHCAAEQARAVAEQLLETVRRHTFTVGGQPIGVTASIGIALFPTHATTVEELLSRADLAMYQAKENGRNCFSFYTVDRDWQAQIESRLGWQNRIREALEKDLLLLYAQPIVDPCRKETSQYELLLRMVGDDGEIVPAAVFIDIAERFGLIQAIDRWVVRRAIHLIAEHSRAGRKIRLEVNLSGKAFSDSELLPMIRRELAATSVDPASLVLEVTETAAIANINEAQKFVRTLKDLGCRFALDDFGAGFSSFYHLKHLPVDYLKIDGSFIRDLPRSTVDQHLVRSIVGVARGLGKETIAEFVGDEETVRLLQEYGVDYAQGYHIGRPGDASDILSDSVGKTDRAA